VRKGWASPLHQFAAPDKTPGKTPDIKCPALVLTRTSALAYLSSVTVALRFSLGCDSN